MYRCIVAGLVAAVSLVSNLAAAEQFRANFSGFEEIGPLLTSTAIAAGMGDTGAILSKGTASLFLNLDKQAGTLEYTLVYANVGTTAPNTGTVTQAHIHFGKHHVAGGIIVFFCTNLNNGPKGTQTCPANGGTVTGTLTAADVVGPSAQNIPVGDFDGLVAARWSTTPPTETSIQLTTARARFAVKSSDVRMIIVYITCRQPVAGTAKGIPAKGIRTERA